MLINKDYYQIYILKYHWITLVDDVVVSNKFLLLKNLN